MLSWLSISKWNIPKGIETQDLVFGHEGAMVLTDELWRDCMLCNVKRNVLDWESSLPNTQTMLIKVFSIPFLWAPEHMDIVKTSSARQEKNTEPLSSEIAKNLTQLSAQELTMTKPIR